MKKIKDFIQKRGIIFVLILAVFFIFFNLTKGGMHGDDAIYSVRSIGLVDYMFSDTQPTPFYFFENFPWWGNLSNHDHPPLLFLIQHVFLLLGQTIFISRLPFAILGILTVFLVYLLLKESINKKMATLGALFLVANSYFIWFSKTSYLEGGIVFFFVLTLYFFLKFLEDKKYWLFFGLSLGLLLITKYTTLFVLPAIFFYLIIKEKIIFKRKELYLSVLIVLIVISPVIIYNLMMYKTLGHFDLQWSGVLGQESPWSLDKTISNNYGLNFVGILKILGNALSFPYLIVFLLSLLYLLFKKSTDLYLNEEKKLKYDRLKNISLFLILFFFIFFVTIITPNDHFLSIVNPLIAILISFFIFSLFSILRGNFKTILSYFVFCFIGFNLFFVFNTHIINKPIGVENILYAKSRNIDYGVYSLDKHLNGLLKGKNVANKMDFYAELKKRDNSLRKYELGNTSVYSSGEKFQPIFAWDSNINWFSGIWLFERRRFYDNLPFLTIEEFNTTKELVGDMGSYYFIKVTEYGPLTSVKYLTELSNNFEKDLISQGAEVQDIKRKDGEVAFKIYKK
jgi:hypothetical protein